MKNWVRGNIDREAGNFGDNLAHGGLLTLLVYGVSIADSDPVMAAASVAYWGVFYGIFAPYLIRRVAIRQPAGDTWRAAAYIAYGAAPFALFIPFWSELTAWPTSLFAYPLVVAWSVTAMVLAVLNRPEPAPSRRRATFLGLAGAIYAVAAGPIFLGFWAGFLSGHWTPPDDETVLALLPMLLGAPIAAGAAYLAIELLGRASEMSRTLD